MRYTIVIPVKDEEAYVQYVLDSVIHQNILPEMCVVIDDNSTDRTQDIVRAYAAKFPFIRYYQFPKEGQYELGGRVVEIFEYGRQIIDHLHLVFDFVVKLDADVSFGDDFFDIVGCRVNHDSPGILSGTPYYFLHGRKIIDRNPLWHSRGQFKIYNVKCLEQTGGIPRSLGWDCADNIKAIEKGWTTIAYPDLFYRIHRRVGNKYSFNKGRLRHGLGAYYLGYDFTYFILRCIIYLFRRPYISGSLYMIAGFVKGSFSDQERILNSSQIRLLRKLQWGTFFTRMSDRFKQVPEANLS
ncbi:MAG TPA: glycosyltransferase family A protein [Bacteroidales bacterium]|nr:glycosyltransferase family A protein [Bacteroidales bacterium]